MTNVFLEGNPKKSFWWSQVGRQLVGVPLIISSICFYCFFRPRIQNGRARERERDESLSMLKRERKKD